MVLEVLHNDNGLGIIHEILHLPGSFEDVPSAYFQPVQTRLVILRVLRSSHPLRSERLDWSTRGVESEIYLSGSQNYEHSTRTNSRVSGLDTDKFMFIIRFLLWATDPLRII